MSEKTEQKPADPGWLHQLGRHWNMGPAKGGKNEWEDGMEMLAVWELSDGSLYSANVSVSVWEDGRASMDDYEGNDFCAYGFEDISWWLPMDAILGTIPEAGILEQMEGALRRIKTWTGADHLSRETREKAMLDINKAASEALVPTDEVTHGGKKDAVR